MRNIRFRKGFYRYDQRAYRVYCGLDNRPDPAHPQWEATATVAGDAVMPPTTLFRSHPDATDATGNQPWNDFLREQWEGVGLWEASIAQELERP